MAHRSWRAGKTVGTAKTGTAVNVFPLSLPDGEGVTLPLGHIGEAGIHKDRGLLLLTVPLGMAALVVGKLGGSIVRGPEGGPSADQRTRVARTWLMLQKGTRIAVPMGLLGEVGVVVV